MENVIFFIGSIAALLTTAGVVPQVIKAHRTRETKDLSILMYLLSSIGLTLWTIYGILTKSPPIIAANTVTLGLSLYLIYLKVKYG